MDLGYSGLGARSEAIPMIEIKCLSDIWLPLNLFQNQKKFIDTSVKKSGIFHILEKPVITDRFSFYSTNAETDDHKNCSLLKEDSSDDLDMLDLLNAYSPTVSVKDSIEDIYNSGDEENACLQEETYNTDFKCTSDHSLNTLCQQSENIGIESQSRGFETEQFQTGISECSNHVDVDNPSCIEDWIKYQNACQRPAIKKQKCNTDVELTSDHSSNILLQQSEKIEKETESNETSNLMEASNGINNEIEYSHTSSECCNHMDMGKPSDSCIEDLIEYPTVYIKPTVEEAVVKQKERKKKKAPKKKKFNAFVPEDDYGTDYNEPFVDEFYEQVMRKERNPPSYASEYPSLLKESQVNYYGSEGMYPSAKQETLQEIDRRYPENVIDVTDETISKKMEINEELDVTNTFVIENIPPDVTEEQLLCLLTGYGDLEKFSLEPCGKFLKAQVKIIGELDWIIDCLNGNQPFGTTSEDLKCYKLC